MSKEAKQICIFLYSYKHNFDGFGDGYPGRSRCLENRSSDVTQHGANGNNAASSFSSKWEPCFTQRFT